MSKKYEDYDEWCLPDNPRAINFDDVIEAASAIRPYIINTPCVPSNYQNDFVMYLYYKLEFLQKTGRQIQDDLDQLSLTRSVKERGAVNVLELLSLDRKKIGICAGSTGNFALSLCYYTNKFNIPTTLVMSHTTPLKKLQKLKKLGAHVIVQGLNILEAQRHARLLAREKGFTFINGRDHPHVLAGYGTIALEILEQVPTVEAILVPIGTGGLAAAIASVVKKLKPKCLIYGIQSEKTPCFFRSLQEGEPMFYPLDPSMADAIAVPIVGCNSFHTAKPLLDKVLLIKEDWIARAMLHLAEKERYVTEGAGAATLGAVIGHLVPELKTKTVVCLLSGGNIDGITFPRCIQRGLAGEGRMMKFRVEIEDCSLAKTQLFRLITRSNLHNIVYQFEDHKWVSEDECRTEMKLVTESPSLFHALELKRIIERAYPCNSVFETEPFNDTRTCPCYVRK